MEAAAAGWRRSRPSTGGSMRSERGWRPSGADARARFGARRLGRGAVHRQAPGLGVVLRRRPHPLPASAGAPRPLARRERGTASLDLRVAVTVQRPGPAGVPTPLPGPHQGGLVRERAVITERVFRQALRREPGRAADGTPPALDLAGSRTAAAAPAAPAPPLVHRRSVADRPTAGAAPHATTSTSAAPGRAASQEVGSPAAAGIPPAAAAVDLASVTEHVLRTLDHRLIAQHERRGGG